MSRDVNDAGELRDVADVPELLAENNRLREALRAIANKVRRGRATANDAAQIDKLLNRGTEARR